MPGTILTRRSGVTARRWRGSRHVKGVGLSTMKMRISFVLPELNMGGGTKVLAQYGRFLTSRGHSVSMLTAAPERRTFKQRMKALLKPAPPLQGHHMLHESIRHIQSCHRGPRIVEDLPEADVLIATWWETAEWIVPAPANKGAKAYFVQDHEVFPYLPVERVAATYRLPFLKIVVSRWLKELMVRTYGSSDVQLVQNGVDLEHFPKRARRRPEHPTFGVLISASPRKNSEMALDAFFKARGKRPELRLLAFGTGPAPDCFRNEPQMRYHRTPDQIAIPSLYASCTAWLFPTVTEGFGLPILESMASGTPVIATRAGAAPDLVDGRNGVLVATDAGAMAEQMLSFSAMDDEQWLSLSSAARHTAEAHDLASAAKRFEEALATAIHG